MSITRWRLLFAGLAVLVTLVFQARPAAAELRLKWDCYLPSTSVDCSVLETSLTSKIPFLRIVRDPQQGYTAPLGVQSGLSVRYLFGNGSLASEDQRWKNVSNLR